MNEDKLRLPGREGGVGGGGGGGIIGSY